MGIGPYIFAEHTSRQENHFSPNSSHLQITSEFPGDSQVSDETRRKVVHPTMHPHRLLRGMLPHPLIQLNDKLHLQLDVLLDHDPQLLLGIPGQHRRRDELLDAVHERGEPPRDGVMGVLGVLVVHVVGAVGLDDVVERIRDRVAPLGFVRSSSAVGFVERCERATAVFVADDGDCVLNDAQNLEGNGGWRMDTHCVGRRVFRRRMQRRTARCRRGGGIG